MDYRLRSCIRLWLAKRLSGVESSSRPVDLEVCIFKPDRIGDFILSIGAIRSLLKHFGETECLLVISPYAADIAELEFANTPRVVIPAFGGVMLWEALPAYLNQRRKLSQYRFQKLVCLRHQRFLFHDVALSWIRADTSYGVKDDMLSARPEEASISAYEFSTLIEYPKTAPEKLCREIEAHRSVLKMVKPIRTEAQDILPAFEKVKTSSSGRFLVSPYGRGPIKNYPNKGLIEAIAMVDAELNIPIGICVGPSDRMRAQALVAELGEVCDPDVEVLETLSLVEYIDAIAQALVVLSVDTATAHIAVALDKPTVVLLGGGHYGIFGPWFRSAKQVWLSNQMDCFGCNWKCIHPEPYCITKVTPISIFESICGVISTGRHG